MVSRCNKYGYLARAAVALFCPLKGNEKRRRVAATVNFGDTSKVESSEIKAQAAALVIGRETYIAKTFVAALDFHPKKIALVFRCSKRFLSQIVEKSP
jgi:hypothetical protein